MFAYFVFFMLLCIFCIILVNAYCVFLVCTKPNLSWIKWQVRALLDTLLEVNSNRSRGHINIFFTLLLGHTQYQGHQRIYCFPFPKKKMRTTNSQDMVFVRPPGISSGGFQLRTDNVWYCKLLLLFSIQSRTHNGIKTFDCAYISVLEEYNCARKPGWCHLATSGLKYAYNAYYDYFTYCVYYSYI